VAISLKKNQIVAGSGRYFSTIDVINRGNLSAEQVRKHVLGRGVENRMIYDCLRRALREMC